MNAGVVEQFGAPAEIYSRPRSRFVADFVGHKNILEGVISESGTEAATMQAGSLTMQVPPAQRRARAGVDPGASAARRARAARERRTAARRPSTTSAISAPSSRSRCASATPRWRATSLRRARRNACAPAMRVHAAWDRDDVDADPGAARLEAMPRWRNRTPYLLCLPLLAFLAAFFLLPVGRMMLLSLTPRGSRRRLPDARALLRPVRRALLPEPHGAHAARSASPPRCSASSWRFRSRS